MGNGQEKSCGDARGLPSDALGRLRREVVAAVESGAPQKQVALTYGVSRKSVGEWVRAYRTRGEESFRTAQRGRRPMEQLALSLPQQERALRIIIAGPPDRVGLPCRLWTRRAVAELINREFGIGLSNATAGRYLLRWGIDTTSDPCWYVPTTNEPTPRSGLLEPVLVPVERLRVAWIRPRLPFGEDPAHALLAVTNRGVLKFLASTRPFDLNALDDLRHRLRMQLGQDLPIVVCSWPSGQIELLSSWLSGEHDVTTPTAWT